MEGSCASVECFQPVTIRSTQKGRNGKRRTWPKIVSEEKKTKQNKQSAASVDYDHYRNTRIPKSNASVKSVTNDKKSMTFRQNRRVATDLVSFQFLIFFLDEEVVLCNLGLNGAEKGAALVRVHRLILETSHRKDSPAKIRPLVKNEIEGPSFSSVAGVVLWRPNAKRQQNRFC